MPPTPDAVARQWFREVWDEGKGEAGRAFLTYRRSGGIRTSPMADFYIVAPNRSSIRNRQSAIRQSKIDDRQSAIRRARS